MFHGISRHWLILVSACSLFMLSQPQFDGSLEISVTKAGAANATTPEKQAFEAAKDLGTVEAWDAFLSNYPTGFHADLARAYVKKLAGSTPAPQQAPVPQQVPVQEPVVSSSIPNVDGIVRVIYDGGTFRMTSPGLWVEQRDTGIRLDYTEILRTSDGVELQANSNPNVVITLDVQGRSVLRREGNSSNKVLYEIRHSERAQLGSSGSSSLPLAIENVCEGQDTLRSRESQEPAKITFVNSTGTRLLLQWIDFSGKRIDYGMLESGAEVTQDSFITHPWVIADQNGRCRTIFLPAPGSSVARLLPAGNERIDAPPPRKVERKPEPKVEQPLRCAKNYKKVGGECVIMQNCGANAYRSAEGDCYCNKNYQMRNGKCVWKQDKQGFEVAPWEKAGCSSLSWLCKQGSSTACASYESNCQVN